MGCHFCHFLLHGIHEDLIDDASHDDEDQEDRRANQGDHPCFQIHDSDSFLFLCCNLDMGKRIIFLLTSQVFMAETSCKYLKKQKEFDSHTPIFFLRD